MPNIDNLNDAPTAPVSQPIHVYVYVEGGNIQASAANVPIELHIMDKDNHEGIDVEKEIKALFAEYQLNCDNIFEHWVTVEEPLNDHLDTSTEEAIPD